MSTPTNGNLSAVESISTKLLEVTRLAEKLDAKLSEAGARNRSTFSSSEEVHVTDGKDEDEEEEEEKSILFGPKVLDVGKNEDEVGEPQAPNVTVTREIVSFYF